MLPAVCLLAGLLALVCRYTIRDVAFVDLADERYELTVSLPNTSGELAERLQALAATTLLDSNVECRLAPAAAGPSARLAGPGGRSLELEFASVFANLEERGVEWLRRIVASPARDRILQHVISSYCVVVLAECDDPAANAAARAAVAAAFVELGGIFDRMPKDVGQPPSLVVVENARLRDERVLLWSLGLAVDARSEPGLAVVFGRARRVGPTLEGEAIGKQTVYGILANIGRSCECEIDRSWMRGPRLPLCWNDRCRREASKLLGFDPDSPLVRAEVGGILTREPKRAAGKQASVEELLLGYSEESAFGETPSDDEREPGKEPVPSAVSTTLTAVLAILVISLLGGVAIVIRTRA